MSTDSVASRNMRLVGGRRVRVLDLLRAGLLEPNDELVYDRRRSGEVYRAAVTEDGRIRLTDGQQFSSPSRAAGAAAGVNAVDGWTAWTVVRGGELLDGIRQRYLDESDAAPPGRPRSPADAGSTQQQSFLKAARDAAASGLPEHTTVRDLIGNWGCVARSSLVDSQIETDLGNHGLTTVPNFRKVGLDTPIRVELVAQLGELAAQASNDSDEGEPVDRGLTVGNLPSALGGVESLAPQGTFDEAITKMLLNDYSQLAVLGSPFTLRGAITWRSIAQSRHRDPDAPISDAIVQVDAVSYDTELIDVLRRLYEDDFIFVKGPDRRISGIVTAADVVLAYGDLSIAVSACRTDRHPAQAVGSQPSST